MHFGILLVSAISMEVKGNFIHHVIIYVSFGLLQIGQFMQNKIMFLMVWHAENGDRIAGFLFEPIQGEAGVCILFT